MPGPSGTPFTPPGGYGPGNTISITLANGEQVLGRFRAYEAGLTTQVNRLCEHLAQKLRDAAMDLVPYDRDNTTEPHVRDNIRVERRGDTWVVAAARGGVRDAVPVYLEIGTYKMAARPFMKPAIDLVLSAGGLFTAVNQVGGLLPPMAPLGQGA